MRLAAFSVFRPGNAAPQSHNLSLVRKIYRYLLEHLPQVRLLVRSDSAGYNYRLMRYCDQEGIEFVIAGRESEAIFQIIQGIRHWERLRGGRENEDVGEGLHFVGPEKEGAVYRLIVVRKRNDQRALFPEFEYSYRLYVTNTDWSQHTVVRFYRKRGDAENVIRELKEGYAADHILWARFVCQPRANDVTKSTEKDAALEFVKGQLSALHNSGQYRPLYLNEAIRSALLIKISSILEGFVKSASSEHGLAYLLFLLASGSRPRSKVDLVKISSRRAQGCVISVGPGQLIPDKGQVMIRYFGLYANAHRGKVRKAEQVAHKLIIIEEECPRSLRRIISPIRNF